MINRGVVGSQIELKAAETSRDAANKAKRGRKPDGLPLQMKKRIRKNIQVISQRPPDLPNRRPEAAGAPPSTRRFSLEAAAGFFLEQELEEIVVLARVAEILAGIEMEGQMPNPARTPPIRESSRMGEEDSGRQLSMPGIVLERSVHRIRSERRIDEVRERLVETEQSFVRTFHD